MAIWALDASTEQLWMAVVTPTGIHTASCASGPATSRALLPQLDSLLAESRSSARDLTGVAVGVGPGAFTGLRSACAAAQGVALALQLQVLPLSSLMIGAEAVRLAQRGVGGSGSNDRAGPYVRVVMDARMGEVYSAAYRWVDGAWLALEMPSVGTPAVVGARWSAAALSSAMAEVPWIVTGTGVGLVQASVDDAAASRLGCECVPQRDWATALGSLAKSRWDWDARCEPAALIPHYVRDRVAQTMAERLEAARSLG